MTSQVFTNCRVFTPALRFERRDVHVVGDRIAACTPPGETPIPPGAARHDLHGTFLIPSFCDAHFHLLALAMHGLRCDLAPAASAAEVTERMRAFARESEAGAVVGVDWDESEWENAELPSREMLDAVSHERPVYARRVCGHVGAVNGVLLELLESPRRYINPLTGVITEDAVFEANKLTYPPPGDMAAGMAIAVATLHSLGVTAIHDIIGTRNLGTYLAGVEACPAPLRIDGLFPVSPAEFDEVAQRVAGARNIRAAGIKIFADGSLGGRTAALHEPYQDGDGNGELTVEPEPLRATLKECVERGITVAVHVIGDRAARTVLSTMAEFAGAGELFRLEHAELLGASELALIEHVRPMLAMQPNFVRRWGARDGLYHRRLGDARWKLHNRYRTLADAGAHVTFSSDGMPAGPLFGLDGAVNHPNPEERIGGDRALAWYTGSAHRWGAHRRPAGAIQNGNLADLVVLSADPTRDPGEARVLATFVSGRCVYKAPRPGEIPRADG